MSGTLRIAYADPPYPGRAHLYKNHPDYAGEVDHTALIEHLQTFDGWALSTSAAALRDLLPLCPAEARVLAWVKAHRHSRLGTDELHDLFPGSGQVSRAWDGALRAGKDDPLVQKGTGERPDVGVSSVPASAERPA